MKRGDEIGFVSNNDDGSGKVIVFWTKWDKKHASVQSCAVADLEPITLEEARMFTKVTP